MAWNVGGSIRVTGVADAAAIAAVHVEAWRETYVGIVPVQVLAGLSVDRRTEIWRRILTNPMAFSSSAVFVAERDRTVVGFGCCGMQRAESLSAQGYDGEISSICVLRAFQRCGRVALMSVMGGELQRRGPQACGSFERTRALADSTKNSTATSLEIRRTFAKMVLSLLR
jgi:hypothetical protein